MTNSRDLVSSSLRGDTQPGIFVRAFSNFLSQVVSTQRLKSQAVEYFWTLAVVCGCWALSGVVCSAIPAHRLDAVSPLVVRQFGPHARRKKKRKAVTVDSSIGGTGSYARYSSDMQEEKSKCRERATENGHEMETELEFADEAVSGTKLHRVGLDAMLAAAKSGRLRVLYFFSLSRLARESVITMPMLKMLVYVYHVRVISATEGVDSNREGWELLATFLSVQHEQYIKDLSANTFRGQEGNVLARLSVGDYCFGYTSVPVPGSEGGRRGRNAKPRRVYALDSETAPWVVRIFYWFVVERRGLRWIARELNRLGAPKDHRASTPKWHHQYLPPLLRNRKYIGIWPWGEKKNVRNPLTGQVRQEDRSEEECEQWTRHFPELQLIDNESFEFAGRLLQANVDKADVNRKPDGKLNGSEAGTAKDHPRHLLSLLICCQACGARFYVGGANGKYLFCPNYDRGTCTCQTKLRRDRAERLILGAIGQRILANLAWQQTVLDLTLAAWGGQRRERPGRIQELENALATVDRKITRLLDLMENEDGTNDPDIKRRLGERRAERRELATELDRLKGKELRTAEGQPVDKEPTAEWVAQKLENLAEVLKEGSPAAAHALRELVGGQVAVEEIREPGRKRYYLRGRFTIKSQSLAKVVMPALANSPEENGEERSQLSEEILIDFVDADPLDELADKAKEFYDQNLTNKEIARQMKCSKSQITKLLNHWSELHGQPLPDGRSRRWELPRGAEEVPPHQQVADEAVALMQKGFSDLKIGRKLACSGFVAGKAIAWWHSTRGLPVPTMKERRLARARLAKSLLDEGRSIEDALIELDCSTTTLYRLLDIACRNLAEPQPDGQSRDQSPPDEPVFPHSNDGGQP